MKSRVITSFDTTTTTYVHNPTPHFPWVNQKFGIDIINMREAEEEKLHECVLVVAAIDGFT